MGNEEVILKELDKYMDDFIDRIFAYSQENLVNDDKIDTGQILKTANVNRAFLSKEIVYPVVYADVIEYGREPGTQPPVEALFKWVRRKLGVKDENEIKRISWAIAKAIKKRGMQPSPYLRPAIERASRDFGLEG